MENSVDSDQIPHTTASYLGLHCLQRPICPNTKGFTIDTNQTVPWSVQFALLSEHF